MDDQVIRLRKQVEDAEVQLRNLKLQLQKAELEAAARQQVEDAYRGGFPAEWIGETLSALNSSDFNAIVPSILHESTSSDERRPPPIPSNWPLAPVEYQRYGRQMIMPEIGLHGQLRLKNSRILIVGVGGLGCPAAAYLAGAGVGTLGLIDGDTVEVSNLHRQIAHGTKRIGMSKVDSAYEYLSSYVAKLHHSSKSAFPNVHRRLNPEVQYSRHNCHLTPEHALTIFEKYDLILDCTDHPTSRYLISDACVLSGKPLVSASALKTEGQLMVLNNEPRMPGDASGGPCYRCIFAKPPPADSVLSCGEGGILGPVVGVMGVLQALEGIKVVTRMSHTSSSKSWNAGSRDSPQPSLLMFSAYGNPQFRAVRLRSRRPNCCVCSANAVITRNSLSSGSLDYVAFCGRTAPVNVLPGEYRISASDFARLPRDASNVLIDTRDETQYAICALRGSINVPWTSNIKAWIGEARQRGALNDNSRHTYVVCRNGNDSQLAAKAIIELTGNAGIVKDIKGGFKAWREEVDSSWPDY